MNPRWILIRRLRGPAFLLTFGVTALLHQWNMLSFGQSWPLYLIVAGVLTLLERAALNDPPLDGSYPGYPSSHYPPAGQPYPQGWSQPVQSAASPSTAIVTTGPAEITHEGRE